MRRIVTVALIAGLALALSAGAAMAASIDCPNADGGYCYGTSIGDGMYGTSKVDRIYGKGGADLIYGYGSGDYIYGGDEAGWGDKLVGGSGSDRLYGQGGDDGVYGNTGDDTVNGGAGDDTVEGGYGNDTINGGSGADRINAQDGEKDVIECADDARDLVYYDRGLDVLRGCSEAGLEESVAPERLFEPDGNVLVSHEGEELCLPEGAVKGHLKHGDEMINPQGCSASERGRG